MDLQEYRVKVSVRNNLILSAIEEMGYKTVAEFVRSTGYCSTQRLNSLICMRGAPINSNGEFTPAAKDLMEILGAAPSDLWSVEQLNMKLKRNSGEMLMGSTEFALAFDRLTLGIEHKAPDEALYEKDLQDKVNEVLSELTPRETQVICMRFGIGSPELTLDEIGQKMRITRERVRQIEVKAMRKLKHPFRQLREILDPTTQEEKIIEMKRNAKWAAGPNATKEEVQKEYKESLAQQVHRMTEKNPSDASWIDELKEKFPALYKEIKEHVSYVAGFYEARLLDQTNRRKEMQ